MQFVIKAVVVDTCKSRQWVGQGSGNIFSGVLNKEVFVVVSVVVSQGLCSVVVFIVR